MNDNYVFHSVKFKAWNNLLDSDSGFRIFYDSNVGSGEIVTFTIKGRTYIDNGGMPKEFIKALFENLHSTAEYTDVYGV